MKNSKFAIISFVLGILISIQAIIAFIDISETNPFAVILFPIVLLLYLPDYPLGNFPQYLGFPIILPALSIMLAFISFIKGEGKKNFAIVGAGLTLASILLYILIR